MNIISKLPITVNSDMRFIDAYILEENEVDIERFLYYGTHKDFSIRHTAYPCSFNNNTLTLDALGNHSYLIIPNNFPVPMEDEILYSYDDGQELHVIYDLHPNIDYEPPDGYLFDNNFPTDCPKCGHIITNLLYNGRINIYCSYCYCWKVYKLITHPDKLRKIYGRVR